jgi:hypothetical protein
MTAQRDRWEHCFDQLKLPPVTPADGACGGGGWQGDDASRSTVLPRPDHRPAVETGSSTRR